MRLRRALDKAKAHRSAADQRANRPTIENVNSKGWTAPVYYESRSLQMNPAKMRDHRCVCMFPNMPENDDYKVLRTQIIHRSKSKNGRSVMITSARSGEGKTVTAVNLAVTFSREFNQTVLLVDGDLRKQDIHTCMGIENDLGLVDYLVGNRSLKDLIIWPGIEKLTVISGGNGMTEGSTELLGSLKMKALVCEMKARYDDRFVLFDVPPVLEGADAMAFAPLVDSVVMVVEVGRTPLADIKAALELLPNDTFLGFVLNRQKK